MSEVDCSNPAVTLGKTFYYYDGEGRRVGKVGGGVTRVFVYDAHGRLAAEYGGAPEVSGTHYVTADHLGTTRVVTDASKAVLECRDYLPFGDELPATSQNGRGAIACYSGETGLRQKFTGKERDAESRLDYFGARYYSWAAGRFTSPDEPFADQLPDDPQSWNLYSYVRNNPLKNTDADGRSCLDGLSNCANYFLGGLKALGNVPTDIVNLPNRLADTLISPFTDFRFGDVLPTPFAPSNFDQQQGMEAAGATMLVTPFVELAVDKFGAAGRIATVELPKTGVRLNRAVGQAFRDEVATGLAKEGRGVELEVYKKTPFGGRKIDIEVSESPGGKVLGGIETKAGNSRYRASQRAKDEYLKKHQDYRVNVVRKPKVPEED